MSRQNNNYQFSSESVSEGHPDKVADQISDAILDAYLSQDPHAKVACECLITTGQCIIAGEVSANAHVDAVAIAKKVIQEIGYTHPDFGFDYATAHFFNLLHEQSREINNSVSDGGAGDQGLMFGYACNETQELMPLPITLSHQLVALQAKLRKSKKLPWLLPDAKAQVTVRYENDQPKQVTKVVLSTQHQPGIQQEEIRAAVIENIIRPVIQDYIGDQEPEYLINPSGSFTIGGPHGDTGLTGRKIIVDTYGGSCPHGGGAFSGKDPSKVDRSAAYAARYIAKHIVASKLVDKATVQLAYAIGVAKPVSVYIHTHGTGKVEDPVIAESIEQLLDLTPKGITQLLNLKRAIYQPTASYGHFGRDSFPWEKIDNTLIRQLREII
jgi:S-adenosylmethionine synthetase